MCRQAGDEISRIFGKGRIGMIPVYIAGGV